MNRLIPLLALAIFSCGPLAVAQSERGLSPLEALASFQCEPGLQIDLVAAEPMVVDPVAMAFDEAARLYVVENRGYPTGPGKGQPPAGIIALLEDTDRDGRFDKRTVFAEGLTFPNGIMPWRGGVLITCAPDILYLKDTDGDGKADRREIVLTGFDDSNTTQLRVSHPTLGPDSWIYVTSGLTGGKIHRPGSTNVVIVKSDLRFRPDTWEFEPVDGKAQFGMSFDDDGHRFICMNRVHVQHVVMSSKYLNRHPAFPFSETVQNVPETMLAEPLPGHGTAAAIYPISHNITTADSHAGTFTAACGVTIYRGTALPQDYYGNVFACDPTGNLVHRDQLIPVGATFAARRINEKREMVASTDDWFRPVFLCIGPDGALYICDMYRKTIEHPTYLPGEVAKHTNFDAGKDKGRIYRLSSKSNAGMKKLPTSAGKTTAELVADLSHPNGWHRDIAHRLLIEKGDAEISPLLREAITGARKSSADGRILALNILNFRSALNESTLSKALSDTEAGVRENALQLAESRLNQSSNLQNQILRVADDPSPRVRFQCALTLANLRQDGFISALVSIASRESPDKWTRAAVLNSATGHEVEFARRYTRRLVDGAASSEPGVISMMQDLGRILGTISNEWTTTLEALLGKSGDAGWQVAALDGYVQSSKVDSGSLRSERIAVLEKKAGELSLNASAPVELRQAAIDLVGRLGLDQSDSLILAILGSPQPPAVQVAAVRAYLALADSTHAARLLESNRWQHYTPAVRETLVETMVAKPSLSLMFLEALETERVPRSGVSTVRRRQLLQNKNSQVSARAVSLFQKFGSDDRMKVFEDWKSVLSLKPDAGRGREVFLKQCSICHRLDRDGMPVGPDLFGMRNQSKETILLHVIVPEYEIMPSFVNYLVDTKSHDSFSGIIAAETPDSITLRGALNQEQIIWRTNIATITSSGLSLMPQEMEKNMSRQDMANLLAYLKGE